MTINLLDTLYTISQSYNIPLREFKAPFGDLEQFDYGLRKKLLPSINYAELGAAVMQVLSPNAFVVVEDFFCFHYAVFTLPTHLDTMFLLGPWRNGELSDEKIHLLKQQLGTTYTNVISNQHKMLHNRSNDTLVRTFANLISLAHPSVSIELTPHTDFVLFRFLAPSVTPTTVHSKQDLPASCVETCYEIEENIMNAVARGDAISALAGFDRLQNFDLVTWTNHPVRKIRCYLLICNTLLRKAIERNEIHPYYSREIFYDFACKIDCIEKETAIKSILTEMVHAYCHCVHQQSLHNYSPQLQKVINYINMNLSEPLSLKSLSEMCHISPSYLSSTFRKETGQTLIDYINERRIRMAAQSLIWDSQKISDIAMQVGILDMNYFTRLFKKILGVTPTEYRKQNGKSDLALKKQIS